MDVLLVMTIGKAAMTIHCIIEYKRAVGDLLDQLAGRCTCSHQRPRCNLAQTPRALRRWLKNIFVQKFLLLGGILRKFAATHSFVLLLTLADETALVSRLAPC